MSSEASGNTTDNTGAAATEEYKVADTAAKNVADMLALDAEDESLRKVCLNVFILRIRMICCFLSLKYNGIYCSHVYFSL